MTIRAALNESHCVLHGGPQIYVNPFKEELEQ
jgi:hypothetical protein